MHVQPVHVHVHVCKHMYVLYKCTCMQGWAIMKNESTIIVCAIIGKFHSTMKLIVE